MALNCENAQSCGGCVWHMKPYEEQLLLKQEELRRNFLVEFEAIPAQSLQAYRSRLLLRGRIEKDKGLSVGYFRRGTREFIAIERCEIANKELIQFIKKLKTLNVEKLPKQRFRLEAQSLLTRDGGILVTIQPGGTDHSGLNALCEEIAHLPLVRWCGLKSACETAPMFLYDEDLSVQFYTQPGIFQQTNPELNRRLRRQIFDFAEKNKVETVLDLFSGSGNLSLGLATPGRKIFGYDRCRDAIRVANFAAKENLRPNAVYSSQRLDGTKLPKMDLIIADPPRSGLGDQIQTILAACPKMIVLVSCNPESLKRDLEYLQSAGYHAKKNHFLDFFPHTQHIESLIFLESFAN